MRLRVWAVLVLSITVAVLAFLLKLYYDAGQFRVVSPLTPGACNLVNGVSGSGDIAIDQIAGRAYIAANSMAADQPSGIFAYDLGAAASPPVLLAIDPPLEVHPRGLGLYRDPLGAVRLFVVDRSPERSAVLIFDVEDGRLRHRRTVTDPLMYSPNDVLATGPASFYVTNDHRATSRWGRTLEEALKLARSYVLFWDGERFQIAASALAFASGIDGSPDGRMVYVAATLGRTVYAFRRDAASGRLQLRTAVEAGTGVARFNVDSRGDLWVAARPHLLDQLFSREAAAVSPSEVIRIGVFPGEHYQSDVIFRDPGYLISSSSVAAVYQKKLLIGSPANDGFLVCDLKN